MTHDFTSGGILKPMVRFTIPLILANYLQLTYNAVDSIIVGRFLGEGALAAVGTTNPLMTLLIMFLRGTSLGAGVLIGSLFGARKYDLLKKQISTAMIAGCAFALLLSVFIAGFARQILILIQVDPEILDMAASYLKIIAFGLIFTFGYNYLSSTMQALGDGRTPLLFLAISASVNIAGDLLFVVKMGMGVHGAAAATVLAEAMSCFLCLFYIHRHVPLLDMGREWFSFDITLLAKTLKYGVVSAVQQATVQLGIIGVQGVVNSLGMNVTAAFSAANRIDDFALIPGRSIANAMTSAIAQNWGAGNRKRIRSTFACGILIDALYGFFSGILLWLFAENFMGLFTSSADVIREGMVYLTLIAPMYALPSCTNCVQGYFRGTGDLKITLVSSIVNMGLRFGTSLYLILVRRMGIAAIPWSCLAGWLGMLAFELPFMVRRSNK
ncbi:MAG: MATE family efflux transporter [Eubacterium sp.]|nr:MATE family efflux transporter [Eubacterium sp.]